MCGILSRAIREALCDSSKQAENVTPRGDACYTLA